MTKCVIQNGKLIHRGEWITKVVEVFDIEQDEIPPNAVIENGFWIKNPLPKDAVVTDLPLAWTSEKRLVLATDEKAVTPFVEGVNP